MTGKCSACNERHELTKQQTVIRHGNKFYDRDTGCKGGGKPPKPGTINR